MGFSIPWYVSLFVSIPETFLCLLLGFKLFNIKVSVKGIFILSLFSAALAYVLRLLPIPFGLHTFILLITLIGLAVILAKLKVTHAILGVLTGILLVGILQGITIPVIFNQFSLGIEDLAVNPMLNIYLFLPSGILMVLLNFLINRFNFKLYNLGNR